MVVEIENWQAKARIDAAAVRLAALRLAELAKAPVDYVTVIVTDDEGISPINEAAVGHVGPTDVITLFYEAIPGDDEGASAEIVINVQCALEQNPENPSWEFAYYLAHAFDHLSGRDDATPQTRTAMHRRERRWLAAIGDALPRDLVKTATARGRGRRSAGAPRRGQGA